MPLSLPFPDSPFKFLLIFTALGPLPRCHINYMLDAKDVLPERPTFPSVGKLSQLLRVLRFERTHFDDQKSAALGTP